MTATMLRWDLPWTTPPISLNDWEHYRVRARKVKEVRAAARILAMAAHLPRDLPHVSVQLVYQPRDRRRRDEDNLVGTLKAICDGLIDYGITPDDTPEYMTKLMPRIDPPVKGQTGRTWLELEWETT